MSELTFALRRQRRGLIIWAASLGAYVLLMASMWPSIRKSASTMQSYVETMPKAFVEAFGASDMTTPAGYLNTELMSVVMPALLITAAIGVTIALTAGYEDAGYFETLLPLPVTRTRMLLTRGLAALLAVAGLGVVVYLSLLAASAAANMHLAAGRIGAAALAVTLLAVLHGAIGYLAAGIGLGRPGAIGLAAGVAVAGFAVNSLFPLVDALRGASRYSPWHWTVGVEPLKNGLSVGGALLTLGVAAVLVAAGTVAFTRRDVHLP